MRAWRVVDVETSWTGKLWLMTFRRKRTPADRDAVLFDPAKVDLVASPPGGGTVDLHIVVDAPWSGSDAQLRSLQDKIHSYVSFALDGQMVAMYPEVAGLPWRIIVTCHSGPPDDRTAELLRRTMEPVRAYGGTLVVNA